jgi:phosphoribosyl 1,2-cyclic phosphodiesterase/DNA-binding response OmpR family regulator
MRIRFWGTRGSIARPGPTTVRYGGNTSCVEVRSARGTLVIIDCGTGGHPLGQTLMSAAPKGVRGHILLSHTHWDHIQGIPFFAPLFEPGNTWDIYGPRGLRESLRETLAGQMQHAYFPVTPDEFGAEVRYHNLLEGAFEIEDIKVSTYYLNHTALTLGYRLEVDGAILAYCCDHEPHSQALANGQGEIAGQDLRYAEFIRGADLLLHDAPYTGSEYPARIAWGHSPVEYAVRLAQHAQVKRLALTHHDPLKDDDAIDGIMAGIQARLRDTGSPLEVFAAVEGQTVEVEPSRARVRAVEPPEKAFPAMTPIEPALATLSVLLGIADPRLLGALSEDIRAEGIAIRLLAAPGESGTLTVNDEPSLAILEHDRSRIDGLAACRAIRQTAGDQLPVVLVAAREDFAGGAAAGVTDWLIQPFTSSYARARIRAWSLRVACRWIRASIPGDEERRLAALRDLHILDTEREERFDRVTRLAAALFNVPIALISLVDENRQWFKSCLGLDSRETSRDVSFCAHVVYHREPMIVPDTFQDARFADNPLVTKEPRIRFYAGYPLILDDGSCVGTMCLLDTRPRSLEEAGVARLRDLAEVALQELRLKAPGQTTRFHAAGSSPAPPYPR